MWLQVSFVDAQSQRVSQESHSKDMPYQEAAVATSSLLDYMVGPTLISEEKFLKVNSAFQLHATDEEGKKMDVELVHSNVLTFLGAGQVTTSSALAWVIFIDLFVGLY